MSLLEREAVKSVRDALIDAGLDDTTIELEQTARSAKDAASAIGCELGAIVKSLVFTLEQQFVLALIAGDNKCLEFFLPQVFNLEGRVKRPTASEVKEVTGFTIGGVAPIGMKKQLPTVIDASFKRFDKIYAAAGHPHCVFSITLENLSRVTTAIVSAEVAEQI